MATVLQRLGRLAPYLKRHRAGLVAAVAGAAVAAATEPAIPALLQPLLDQGFERGALPLWLVPLAIIGLFALRGAAGFVAQYGLAWTANRAVLELRERMFARLLDAEPALYSRQTASALTNTVVYEVQAGTQQLIGALLTLVKDSLTLVALLAYLMWLNWQLTLFVALLFPAVAWVMRVLSRRLHRLTVEGQQATDALAYVVEENVLAWKSVRLHAAGAAQAGRFRTEAERLRRLVMKAVIAWATMAPITQLLAACALSAVIVVALVQAGSGGATVGGFVAFVTAMLMLVAPIKHLSDVMAPITRGLAAVERGLDLVDRVPAERGGSHTVARARGEIALEGVSLRFAARGGEPGPAPPPSAAAPLAESGEASPFALEDIELVIPAGQTVALIGPSGAGKTTLVSLLARFVEPTAGAVRLDGVPLREWDIAALRRQFALVSQDVVLFDDTIAANVALGAGGDSAPDPARVEAALRAAHLWDFVGSLPQGLHTNVGHNGGRLSGGQRQRVAIARAVYKDAPVLILDEATSALDNESERAVQAALAALMQGRTSIVIAHRLSTIEGAHRVLVLDRGRLVEEGTPAALLRAGGLYARLHAMQFRGGAEPAAPPAHPAHPATAAGATLR